LTAEATLGAFSLGKPRDCSMRGETMGLHTPMRATTSHLLNRIHRISHG
jgi:hypothetical protein